MAATPALGGFALWLMPTGDTYDRLAEVIRALSARFRTPRFEPHVSLVGGVSGPQDSVLARTAELAGSLRPLEVRLLTPYARQDYFQSLVVKVEPTRELIEAQARARVVLGGKQSGPFFPHLSLMYGRTPMEKKEAVLRELGDGFQDTFVALSVEVVSLSGAPEDWRRLAAYPMRERRKRPRSG